MLGVPVISPDSTPVNVAPVKSTEARLKPVSVALVRLAPGPSKKPPKSAHFRGRAAGVPCRYPVETLVIVAPVKVTPSIVALVKDTPVKFAPVKFALVRFAPSSWAPLRLAPVKLRFHSAALRQSMPRKSHPDKSDPLERSTHPLADAFAACGAAIGVPMMHTRMIVVRINCRMC